MDVWSILATIVAGAIVIVLGPPVLLRRWSWGERIAALRARLADRAGRSR